MVEIGLLIVIVLVSIAFSAVTTVGICRKHYEKMDMGNLIISDNPDEEFLSLKLTKNPNELLKHDYILLWVEKS